ncbi:MAG: hypothetical protein AAGK01_11755, partial [Pseudomonadota bacterium]
VVEGEVQVAAGSKDITTAAGFGVASAGDMLGENEELLPAPMFIEPGQIQTAETVSFALEPLTGASAFRTQIATDAGFVDVIADVISDTKEVDFGALEDGRYNIRSRAVSEDGLEGLFTRVESFRRKRVGVAAAAEPAPFEDALKFAWRAEGSGDSTHAFQLWLSDKPGELLVDEVGLTNSAVLISSLDPGTYKWRVATFQIDEGDVIKVWGPTQELNVSE